MGGVTLRRPDLPPSDAGLACHTPKRQESLVADRARHQGKVAIVTGAANGIGRASVLRLASEGATVVGCDVNAAALSETEQLLTEAGKTAQLVVADISRQEDVDRVAAAAGPTIDIPADVAGIMDNFVPLGELDDALWEHVMSVNVTGVMRLTRAVLPTMEAAGHGAIVTVASKASLGADRLESRTRRPSTP